MKQKILLFLIIIITLSAGCSNGLPEYDRDVWLYSIDSSGNLNWNRCIDCSSMQTANSLLEDKNGNYIIGGSGISEHIPDALIPEIVWVSPKGELIEKKYYGTKVDGGVTTLSNDTRGNIFAVCYSGKSLILDETGAPVHIISINATEPGGWVSLNTQEGYAAASRTEAFAISDNGTLLWHTIFQENETPSIRPWFIMNHDGNYVIASPYTYENENYILLAELDNEGTIMRKNIFPNLGIQDSGIYFMQQKKNGDYEFTGNCSIFSVDKNGENLSVIPGETINYSRHYWNSGKCYAESVTGSESLFGREDNQIRLITKDSAGDIILDKYYKAGNFYDRISDVIETSEKGYAILVRHETYE